MLARFPARLPELFCHHRVCVQARCKGIGGGSGIASSSPGPSAPPQTRRRRRARRIVAEPSPATRASSLPPRARGRSASRPPLARPTHAREIRFTNNDNGSAGARVAAPGRDAPRDATPGASHAWLSSRQNPEPRENIATRRVAGSGGLGAARPRRETRAGVGSSARVARVTTRFSFRGDAADVASRPVAARARARASAKSSPRRVRRFGDSKLYPLFSAQAADLLAHPHTSFPS